MCILQNWEESTRFPKSRACPVCCYSIPKSNPVADMMVIESSYYEWQSSHDFSLPGRKYKTTNPSVNFLFFSPSQLLLRLCLGLITFVCQEFIHKPGLGWKPASPPPFLPPSLPLSQAVQWALTLCQGLWNGLEKQNPCFTDFKFW